MASVISHPAVPLAIAVALGNGRVPRRLAVAACAVSALPDIDAIGFQAGIPYESVLGHRGVTHSLFFALIAGGAAALSSRALRSSPAISAVVIFIATASHGVLDALTTGGLGVAFFAPLSNQRYFFPWRVIQVSPIGVSPFFSEWGLRVLRSELTWVWAPSAALGALGYFIRKANQSPLRHEGTKEP